jgi:hypothetical protein
MEEVNTETGSKPADFEPRLVYRKIPWQSKEA